MPAWQGPPCTCFAAVTGASGQLSADARGQLWSAASQRPCWCLAGPAWAPGTAPPLSWEETRRKEQTLEMPTSRSPAQWRTEGVAALGVGGTGCQGRAAPPPPLSTPLPGLTTPGLGDSLPLRPTPGRKHFLSPQGSLSAPPLSRFCPLRTRTGHRVLGTEHLRWPVALVLGSGILMLGLGSGPWCLHLLVTPPGPAVPRPALYGVGGS